MIDRSILRVNAVLDPPDHRRPLVSSSQCIKLQITRNEVVAFSSQYSLGKLQLPFDGISIKETEDGLYLTSGGKGLHVAVESPTDRGCADFVLTSVLTRLLRAAVRDDWDRVRTIAKRFGLLKKRHNMMLLSVVLAILLIGGVVGLCFERFLANPKLLWLLLLPAILVQVVWTLIRNRTAGTSDITLQDAADIIASFVDGTCGPYDWDDFTSAAISDQAVAQIQKECLRVENDFPPRHNQEWCNPEGCKALRKIAERIRNDAPSPPNAVPEE